MMGSVRQFSRAIKLYGPDEPASYWSYYYRALAQENLGRLEDALSDYDKTVALNTAFTGAYRDAGIVLAKLNRYDEALKKFDAALRQNAKSSSTLIARADTFEKMGRQADALTDYGSAVESDRSVYDVLIANSYQVPETSVTPRERVEEERKQWIAARDRSMSRAYVGRGNLLRTMGRSDAALADYAKALELRPGDGYIYVQRGWLYEQRGQHDLALADYERAVTLMTPDSWLEDALERTRK